MKCCTRFVLIVVALAVPRVAFSECVTLSMSEAVKSAAIVFTGTMTNVTATKVVDWPGEIATFNVDRVWKGPVTKRFVIYSAAPYSLEFFHFALGMRYIVLAHAHTAAERKQFGIAVSTPPTFGVGGCGGGTREFSRFKAELAQLGPGTAPTR